MKHFRSEFAFQKHKPHVSWHKRFFNFFKKKKYIAVQSQNVLHYKTNPFRAPKESAGSNIKAFILIAILIIWVICLAYIPYFRVNKINYFGLNNNTKNELDEFIYQNFLNKKSILPVNNYFFVDTDKISERLYNVFALESVEIIKIFPNQLDVKIKEKISSVIYDNGKQYFLLDSRGTVTKYLRDVESYEVLQQTITSSSASLLETAVFSSSSIASTSIIKHTPDYKKITKSFGNYPIIYDQRGIDLQVKQQDVLPSEHITAIINWFNYLNKGGAADKVNFFALDSLYSGIKIKTSDRWDILFKPTNNTETEINNLKEILTSVKPQEYVDLRFGEKIYWK